MRRSATIVLSGLAALAACSKSQPAAPGAPAGGSTAAVAPAAPAKPSVAALFSKPQRKPGLWSISISTSTGPGLKLGGEVCVDAETEKSASFNTSPTGSKACAQNSFSPAPGGVAFDTTCKFDNRTIVSHGVATGDFSSNYTVDVSTHMDPPLPGGQGDSKSHIEAHWLGPCKPGQTPGHMTMKMGRFGQG